MILETIVAWAAQAIPHFSFFLILLVVSSPARVQRPAGEMVGPNNATGVLKAMDQLIRHNPKLEQHNQRLTNRIIALRQALAARRMLAHVTPPQKSYAPAMTNAPDTLSVQASVNNTNSAPQSTSQPGARRWRLFPEGDGHALSIRALSRCRSGNAGFDRWPDRPDV